MPVIEAKQFKTVSLCEFKALDGESGGGQGYPSTFYDLDEVGDIVMPGAYQADLTDFLRDGFVGNAHEWDEAIGFPTEAREDAKGLWASWEFHSTSDAQAVRLKAQERAAAGKSVKLSIGYQTEACVEIGRESYATELPKYIPSSHIAAVLEKAQQFYCVRLLTKVKLFEFSFVTVPANRSAEVTGIKALAGGSVDELSFSERLRVVVDATQEMVGSIKARKEMRFKEGRKLSGATIERMKSVHANLLESCDHIGAMLAEAEPPEKEKSAPNIALLREEMRVQERRVLARIAA